MSFYKRVGLFLPRKTAEAFHKQMIYCGIDKEEEEYVGSAFVSSLAIAIVIPIIALVVFGEQMTEPLISILGGLTYIFYSMPIIAYIIEFAVLMLALFALFFGGRYLALNISAEGRGRIVEKLLPDVLQLVSANMKSGLTTERALLASARPEFGIFSEELRKASGRVMAGERIEEAMSDISLGIKSQLLERTIWLMVQGIKSGGEVADLLTQLADDVREENALKEEASAEVNMYVLFIFVATALAAPVLASVSSYIVGIMSNPPVPPGTGMDPEKMKEYLQRNPVGRFASIGMGSSMGITEEFAFYYSMASLIVTTVCASLVIGVINTGKEKDGVKYLLIIVPLALILFLLGGFVLEAFIGGIKL